MAWDTTIHIPFTEPEWLVEEMSPLHSAFHLWSILDKERVRNEQTSHESAYLGGAELTSHANGSCRRRLQPQLEVYWYTRCPPHFDGRQLLLCVPRKALDFTGTQFVIGSVEYLWICVSTFLGLTLSERQAVPNCGSTLVHCLLAIEIRGLASLRDFPAAHRISGSS